MTYNAKMAAALSRFLRPHATGSESLLRGPNAPKGIDLPAALAARTIRAFDAAFIAPLHGHASSDAYYASASTISRLHEIAVPTLILAAADDPICDSSCITQSSDFVDVVLTNEGGHVAWPLSDSWGLPCRGPSWENQAIVSYLQWRHTHQ
jgi:predicted alpha/beta-fold hydrolase